MSLQHSSWTRAWPLLAVLFAGLGCNSILGIDEAVTDPNWDQNSGTGGDGTGGEDGTGGNDATGGSDGTGGTTTSCDFSASDIPDDLLRGCVLRASCDPWSGYSVSSCVSYGIQRQTGPEECTKNATSCEEVDACLGRALLSDGDATCNMSTAEWLCAPGNVAYNCDDSPYRFDCSEYGGTCLEYLEGATTSGMPPCRLDTTACDEPAGEFHCAGNKRYECINGVRYGTDCGLRDSTCVEQDAGDAYCQSSQTNCSDTSGDFSCSGSQLSQCAEGGLLQNWDCAGAGLDCSEDGYCLAPGCTSDDADDCAEGCNGSNMKICVGGASVTIDCSDYGYSNCALLDSAAYCYGTADVPVTMDDSCEFALDNVCEEPADCAPGTDTTDCFSNSCSYAYDDICDEPFNCEVGTDTADCAAN